MSLSNCLIWSSSFLHSPVHFKGWDCTKMEGKEKGKFLQHQVFVSFGDAALQSHPAICLLQSKHGCQALHQGELYQQLWIELLLWSSNYFLVLSHQSNTNVWFHWFSWEKSNDCEKSPLKTLTHMQLIPRPSDFFQTIGNFPKFWFAEKDIQ